MELEQERDEIEATVVEAALGHRGWHGDGIGESPNPNPNPNPDPN